MTATHPRRPRRKTKHLLPLWTHPPLYQTVRAVTAGFHMLGPQTSLRGLRRLAGGYATSKFGARRLARAKENLAWCFPDWPAERVDAVAVESIRHLVCLAAEVALAPRLVSPTGYSRTIEFADIPVPLERALSGRPCIVITGHSGNWEILGCALGMLGFPIHAVYRPLDIKPLDDWVLQTRSRRGLTLISKFGAVAQLPPLLESRALVGFTADQNAGDRGLFVPFFGRLASTYKAISLLAVRFEASVICGHAVRLAPTLEHPEAPLRYRVEVTDVIDPEHWSDAPDPHFYITARYRRAIEQMVHRAPEQYLWMHRYWKSRPRFEREGREFPERLREKLAALPWMTDAELEQLIAASAGQGQ